MLLRLSMFVSVISTPSPSSSTSGRCGARRTRALGHLRAARSAAQSRCVLWQRPAWVEGERAPGACGMRTWIVLGVSSLRITVAVPARAGVFVAMTRCGVGGRSVTMIYLRLRCASVSWLHACVMEIPFQFREDRILHVRQREVRFRSDRAFTGVCRRQWDKSYWPLQVRRAH